MPEDEQNWQGLKEKADRFPFEAGDAPEMVAPKKSAIVRANPLRASERGLLVGGSLEEQYRLARYYCESRLMPQALNTPEKVLVALQLCHELRLPPMMSIGRICVINGTPSLFGDLPLALVRRSGLIIGHVEGWQDKDGKEICPENGNLSALAESSYCSLARVGEEPITRTFTRREAEAAGLWGKKVWAQYPKRMLQLRARGNALKDLFPDVLFGLNQAEYDFGVGPEFEEPPSRTVADELNEAYLGVAGGEEEKAEERGGAEGGEK